MCSTVCLYVPEDAEDHDGRGKRYERNTVADRVADLHLPEKLALTNKEYKNSVRSVWMTRK